ncbi:hypothetical protein ACJ6WF_17545 [Streptomyces sp. MMS24-I2-30]|uniref:hypothetical protein n=1 Tax=Streptomyces sp. MMS24-I2-30 TaxID=3351564 RepID=UPI0038969FC1
MIALSVTDGEGTATAPKAEDHDQAEDNEPSPACPQEPSYQLTLYDDSTRYVLVAHPRGAAS